VAIFPTWNERTPGIGFRYLFAPSINFSVSAGSTQKMTTCENMAATFAAMFSHVVIFWVDPADTDKLIEGANKYLKPIPGVLSFHVGKMVGSHRPVVDQTYQVALNLIFANKKAQDDYQVHPMHVEFVDKVFKPIMKRVVVYDFE
jgi:hypothetical protein